MGQPWGPRNIPTSVFIRTRVAASLLYPQCHSDLHDSPAGEVLFAHFTEEDIKAQGG